ncbi:NEK/NEK1 protein kinase [Phytophthora nicotianae CJ01A1]|uniref:non-specific serine/threonine protein kinase n=6 Tax=Phytophthora nicotianae TaxID=4792 RepID=W2PCL5_PHYN3|nr:NEK/NEK1 protein kinase [Phytophthora nicotianae INRA-310]ETK93919.1 NEK/NEK1 protein kinase [Phytophthora nicotianae]ETO82762.1 NEK/NEK1 protein kinase [Phytophthora nicotianae P1976]ETP23867.1 NEK/NEK1 protein kinase [Phytophthora nicotianae CJ01A1]ETL47307.1 NEK/NEK1 protein kinase [Phytophthora nicotianae]ETM98586.1 NEK/NEK1 protein kinase [Phytophthora nicotianae INRA-310]
MDGYSRVKLLGEGSFGRVFLMREKKSGDRLVCVKEIHRMHCPKRSTFAGRGKSVDVELDLMKKLRHPNLIRLLASVVGPPPLRQQFIVMEYCSGGDLQTYIKTNGRQKSCLDEDAIWYWFVQLALGLHHMHQQRVLHRDLKTANIFLSHAGYLVLGDFGIARTLRNDDMATTMIGTPLYMAPEVLDGKEYSFSSDVWALGCVLYELCTGKPPFTANNAAQLVNKICHVDYVPIQKGGSLKTSRLPTLVASMLNARPDLRPSVDQLLHDSIARVHIRRYCKDRLHSTDINADEQRVLLQQIAVLGTNSSVDNAMNTTIRIDSYSRHKIHTDRDQEDREKKLMEVRERERRDQIQFALEELQQLKLRFPAACDSEPIVSTANEKVEEVKNPVPEIRLDVCKAPLLDEEWREPVRAVTEIPRSVVQTEQQGQARLGRANSVPKELIFTGIPRVGVPLTQMAKTFASRHPVSRDIRALRRTEVAKAAERYKHRLDAMNTTQEWRNGTQTHK